ncbi:MAG TPA: hypothetical protein V6C65_27975 [Allocoleopsis sp.]
MNIPLRISKELEVKLENVHYNLNDLDWSDLVEYAQAVVQFE